MAWSSSASREGCSARYTSARTGWPAAHWERWSARRLAMRSLITPPTGTQLAGHPFKGPPELFPQRVRSGAAVGRDLGPAPALGPLVHQPALLVGQFLLRPVE